MTEVISDDGDFNRDYNTNVVNNILSGNDVMNVSFLVEQKDGSKISFEPLNAVVSINSNQHTTWALYEIDNKLNFGVVT
jgi:hypothetical protein